MLETIREISGKIFMLSSSINKFSVILEELTRKQIIAILQGWK